MPSVLSCFASTLLLFAAALRVNDGMTSYNDTIKAWSTLSRAEFTAHQCGSILAAQENVRLAGEHLATKRELEAIPWDDIVATVHDELSSLDPELNCRGDTLQLHAESPESTPRGFPNIIYRLSWRGEVLPNG